MEKNQKKLKFTILGISVWKLLAYFIIYSVIGYIIEITFGVLTKGVLESRQSFLYGPFCGIYGLGAVIMTIFLQYFRKNGFTLFVGGFIVGSTVEYLVSLLGELLLNIKWWDYSNMPLNVGGRICFAYSLFWGLLGIYLIRVANPKMDKFIDIIKSKLSPKLLKISTVLVTIFLLANCIITAFALNLFFVRMVTLNNIEVKDNVAISRIYNDVYSNEKLSNFIYKFWGDKKMIRTFPNIKVATKDGELVYFDSLLKDIQPYYYKFHYIGKVTN